MKQTYEPPLIKWLAVSMQDILASSGEIDNELPDEENPFGN